MALRKEVPPFRLPVKKSLYVGRLCRPFLAFLHGLIVGHIFLFQRFRLRRCPKTDGAVVDVHPLMPLAVYLLRLGYHDLVNELVDDFRCQLRQLGGSVQTQS